ncbi:sugar phosphate nucleotidyltransferase [Chlorobium ferrooxidans]|uniref:Glucosamine-1-phosphate N-acetyltransferase n=1 Tax=Chlorobium ferrooxidans DSM 13031 TaxID=377431 RepID=Q0YSK5_9CHLB|nr:sugar phosphate nucleotidyltransferase [Chlorobium ferrooxidans]EAT59194.1 Glucosamine-1-phosphate N-acetyltransferase [Chlorobium ferrooxidans DSM 13031]
MGLAVIIMAAGKGTRMHSDLPKVLHRANGKPLVEYVLDTANALDPEKVVLIVGHQAEQVKQATAGYALIAALQKPQLGTGHAVMQAKEALRNFDGEVLILSGDAPLVTLRSLQQLIAFHRSRSAVATVLTADLADPSGYGRVIRHNKSDIVLKIVEHKDATEEERAVSEINSGIYLFDAAVLFTALGEITTNNAQHEYYLTDVFSICFKSGKRVCAFKTGNPDEILGINTPEQLKEAEAILLNQQA